MNGAYLRCLDAAINVVLRPMLITTINY
jgi:hypothetical protein